MAKARKGVQSFLLKCRMTPEHIERAVAHPAYCVYALPIKDAMMEHFGVFHSESRVKVDAFGIAHVTKKNIRYRAVVPSHSVVRALDAATTPEARAALHRLIKPQAFTLKFVYERRKQATSEKVKAYDRNRQRKKRRMINGQRIPVQARPRQAHLLVVSAQ
jgi:hypothetical protein